MISEGLFNEAEGDVAQLGERLHGMQEVRGSIPLVSKLRKPDESQAFFILSKLGFEHSA